MNLMLLCTLLFVTAACFARSAAAREGGAAPVFHGYFYTQDPETDTLVKLPFTKEDAATFKKLIGGTFKEITEEKYWRSFGRFMMTHAPKGYVAWQDKIYWVIALPKVGDDHKYVKDTHGIHVIEFSPGKMRHHWVEIKKDNEDDPLTTFIYVPWDWLLDGEGKDRQKKMTPAEKKILSSNLDWTDAVHDRMNKKFPAEKEWKD
jgi:hypothetical protein